MMQQGDECVAGVQVPIMVFEIFVGQENLGDGEAERAEHLLVEGHEPGLTYCRAGLKLREFVGTTRVTEGSHAGPHRARRDQHHFLAALALFRNLGDELLHLAQVRLLSRVGKDARPHLDHNTGYIL